MRKYTDSHSAGRQLCSFCTVVRSCTARIYLDKIALNPLVARNNQSVSLRRQTRSLGLVKRRVVFCKTHFALSVLYKQETDHTVWRIGGETTNTHDGGTLMKLSELRLTSSLHGWDPLRYRAASE